MFTHREGRGGNPDIQPRFLCLPERGPQVLSSLTQRPNIVTAAQRCWDREGSGWSPAVQSHPGSRVEVTDSQGQEMTYCQGLG